MIPDSIEPVEGWKILWLYDGHLRSPQRGTVWPHNKRLVAECGNRLHHIAPGELPCHCGIYMVRDASAAINYIYGASRVALVKLKGWGKVFPAAGGARVQYAYPTEIIPLNDFGQRWSTSDLRRLQKSYQVPVRPASLESVVLSRRSERFDEQILKLQNAPLVEAGKHRRRSLGLTAGVTSMWATANAGVAFVFQRPGFYVNAAVATAATLLLLWSLKKLRQAGL